MKLNNFLNSIYLVLFQLDPIELFVFGTVLLGIILLIVLLVYILLTAKQE